MALINCPECGKKISDTADKCIYCGFPICKKENHKKMSVIMPISAVLIVCVIVGIILIMPKKIYNHALKQYENGKYTHAIELLEKIKFYDLAETTIEQLKWEYKVYQCVQSGKEALKNPDSYKIYDVKFYLSESTAKDTLLFCNTSDSDAASYPAVVIKSTATNGFGGTVPSYDLFLYDSKDKTYVFVGMCKSLDISSYSGNYLTENDEVGSIVCSAINEYIDEAGEMKNISIDIDRVNRLSKLRNSE